VSRFWVRQAASRAFSKSRGDAAVLGVRFGCDDVRSVDVAGADGALGRDVTPSGNGSEGGERRNLGCAPRTVGDK
jgi:hypothetical protein